jgi:hypothetical protein
VRGAPTRASASLRRSYRREDQICSVFQKCSRRVSTSSTSNPALPRPAVVMPRLSSSPPGKMKRVMARVVAVAPDRGLMEMQAAGFQQTADVAEVGIVLGEAQMLEHLDLRQGVIGPPVHDIAIVAQLQRHAVLQAEAGDLGQAIVELGL